MLVPVVTGMLANLMVAGTNFGFRNTDPLTVARMKTGFCNMVDHKVVLPVGLRICSTCYYPPASKGDYHHICYTP